MKYSKLGLIFSLSYLGLFLLVAINTIYRVIFHAGTSEFAGLPAILLSMPWSMMFAPYIKSFGYVDWVRQFSHNKPLYGLLSVLDLLPGAIINAVILYYIGKFFEKNKTDNISL